MTKQALTLIAVVISLALVAGGRVMSYELGVPNFHLQTFLRPRAAGERYQEEILDLDNLFRVRLSDMDAASAINNELKSKLNAHTRLTIKGLNALVLFRINPHQMAYFISTRTHFYLMQHHVRIDFDELLRKMKDAIEKGTEPQPVPIKYGVGSVAWRLQDGMLIIEPIGTISPAPPGKISLDREALASI